MDPTNNFLNEEKNICDFFSLITITSYPIDVIKTSIFTEILIPIH